MVQYDNIIGINEFLKEWWTMEDRKSNFPIKVFIKVMVGSLIASNLLMPSIINADQQFSLENILLV